MMKLARNLYHLIGAARLSLSGASLGKKTVVSAFGSIEIDKGAKVILSDSVVLSPGYRIKAEGNSEISIGAGVFIGSCVKLSTTPGAKISIEAGAFLNHDISIVSQNSVTVGSDTLFGPYCYVSDHNHRTPKGVSIKESGFDTCPILVGDGAWLGVGATLLKGSSVGNGAVIAARAVVTKPVPDNEIWGGIPAKKLGERI